MKTPSADDLRTAAMWCAVHDDEGDAESEAVRRVGEWLQEQANAKDLRDCAKEHQMPVSKLKSMIKKATSIGETK